MNTEPVTPETRQEILWQLHEALMRHFLKVLESADEVKASMLSAVAKFLADNGVTAMSMGRKSLHDGLTQLDKDMSLPFQFDS